MHRENAARLGQQVVVDNRGGAGGIIGMGEERNDRIGMLVMLAGRTLERSGSGRSSIFGQGEMDPRMEEFFRRFGLPIPNQPGPRGQRPQPRAPRHRPPPIFARVDHCRPCANDPAKLGSRCAIATKAALTAPEPGSRLPEVSASSRC